jgi:hypothetical protein
MDWSSFTRFLPIITASVAVLSGLLLIYATYRINRFRIKQAETEREIAELKLTSTKSECDYKTRQAEMEKEIVEMRLSNIRNEFENKSTVLDHTSKITTEISRSISQQLINDPTWLDRFMDQTGVTYRASVYGKRIGHFFYEKRRLAEEAINRIEEYLRKDENTQYCLLIDSGTTLYPVFQEITTRLNQKSKKDLWREKVCIVTNNIPGVQYLMKNGKEDLNDDHSEIIIDCFLIPGKPLSVYAAITGSESTKWLLGLKDFLQTWKRENMDVKVIGLITGNYIARKLVNGRVQYYPVARGEGHVEIKRTMAEISDEVFLLSPLMKFSFAGVELLNEVNGFDIDRQDMENAKHNPRRVKYEEISIPDNKKCTFFTTRRAKDALFERFSDTLYYELLRSYKAHCIVMPEFDIRYWNPNIEESRQLEIEREIPHDNLRARYLEGTNIWSHGWVAEKEG